MPEVPASRRDTASALHPGQRLRRRCHRRIVLVQAAPHLPALTRLKDHESSAPPAAAGHMPASSLSRALALMCIPSPQARNDLPLRPASCATRACCISVTGTSTCVGGLRPGVLRVRAGRVDGIEERWALERLRAHEVRAGPAALPGPGSPSPSMGCPCSCRRGAGAPRRQVWSDAAVGGGSTRRLEAHVVSPGPDVCSDPGRSTPLPSRSSCSSRVSTSRTGMLLVGGAARPLCRSDCPGPVAQSCWATSRRVPVERRRAWARPCRPAPQSLASAARDQCE
jgi:hypothetical protein